MNYKYTVSVKKDTNKVISSSEDRFTGISDGTLVKIDGDPHLHTVCGKDTFFYLNDFNTHDSKTIIINDDTALNLQRNDTLKITFKEYEAKFLINIKEPGIGYRKGDIINVKGGVSSFDIFSGISRPTVLEVVESDGDGIALKLNILDGGKYLVTPPSPSECYGKRGEGILLDIHFSEISNRSLIERNIMDIFFKEGKTYIILDYTLPINLVSGKISCYKTIMTLSNNYSGETTRNANYEIFNHFTPNLKLPLLLKNSMSTELVYNKACVILDQEIAKIKAALHIK